MGQVQPFKIILSSLLFCMTGPVYAGAYIFAGEDVNGADTYVDVVTHPSTYTGSGGTVTVRVCIDPASPNATDMAFSVQNNIAVYNQLAPTTANVKQGGDNNIPQGQLDFESVALHEIGHCLGMAHINAASESGLTASQQNYTRATDGVDDAFDLNAGADGVIGSSDDIRGDDVNLLWFRTSNNDPFTIDTVVDSTTYSRNLSDLPPGHSYAANADRAVSTLLGYAKTEAVMQQGTFSDEAQRTLGHDDVATLRYAASGIDERDSGGPGNRYSRDNYTIVLEYGGISDSGCDISMSITSTPSLAFCEVSGTFIGADHARITTASIQFGDAYNWFFNTDNTAPQMALIGNQYLDEGENLVLQISASDAEADDLSYSISGLPAYASFVDNADNTATLTLAPALGDASMNSITVTVSDDGVPVFSDSETFDVEVIALDTDSDGISDFEEITIYFTLPDNADSDGDYIGDGEEVNNGSDPLDPLSWPNYADGDLAPLGSPDGLINAADYLIAQRIAIGDLAATSLELSHGDLYPAGAPDGIINTSDLILLLKLLQQ
ncbi:MAG: hypothetical protein HKP22_06640 [Gammaproteobacteria bacterium]|nr:hypothetical protein [Gammaproteobacteria bacterium]